MDFSEGQEEVGEDEDATGLLLLSVELELLAGAAMRVAREGAATIDPSGASEVGVDIVESRAKGTRKYLIVL